MATLTPNTLWPPLVKVVIAWLNGRLTDTPVVYDTTSIYVNGQSLTLSAAVAQTRGVVQVIKTPGGGRGVSDLDGVGLIDLYFYAKDVGAVEDLAQVGHSAMVQLGGRSAAGWLIDDVHCDSEPGEVTYSDPTVQRWVGSYSLTSTPQQ